MKKYFLSVLRAEDIKHMVTLHGHLGSASASSSRSIMIGEVVFSGC